MKVDELPVEEQEDRLTFTWLPVTAPPEMTDATMRLLAAIIKRAKKLKRVTVTERDTDNPRYTFRCFLLRLGFIGDEYKTVRKYLMQSIPGNGSKRHPAIEFDVEPEVKEQAEVVLEQFGIPMSNAIGLFLRQVVLQRGISFEIRLPSNRPLDIGTMSKEAFDAEVQKGMNSFAAGRTSSAADVHARMRTSMRKDIV